MQVTEERLSLMYSCYILDLGGILQSLSLKAYDGPKLIPVPTASESRHLGIRSSLGFHADCSISLSLGD